MEGMMKAVQKFEPARGCRLIECPIPKIGPQDLLVRVDATAVCKSDEEVWTWTGVVKTANYPTPFIMGHEYAGTVVEKGDLVEGFEIGDLVAGETHVSCGVCRTCRTGNQHICGNHMKVLGRTVDGCFAEYLCMPAKSAILLPKGFDPRYGAIMEPYGVALHGVMEAQVSGKTAMIVGVGAIGSMAVQAAKILGALRVIAVDVVQDRLDACKELGADVIINSMEQNMVEEVMKVTDGVGVDCIVDFTGNNKVINQEIDALTTAGKLRILGMVNSQLIIDNYMLRCAYRQLDIKGLYGRRMFETWEQLVDIIKTGRVDFEKFLSETLPMSQINDIMENFAKYNGRVILDPTK